MELIAQALKFFNNMFGIFNLFQSPEMKKAKEAAKDKETQDKIEKALKKGDHEELDKYSN